LKFRCQLDINEPYSAGLADLKRVDHELRRDPTDRVGLHLRSCAARSVASPHSARAAPEPALTRPGQVPSDSFAVPRTSWPICALT